MCHRVPAGPAPVLASDFHANRPARQGMPQQTAQAKPAEPLHQIAPRADTLGPQPVQCVAIAPPPQANQPAAPSVAPQQQHKQDTKCADKPPTNKAHTASGYAADSDECCCACYRLRYLYLRTSKTPHSVTPFATTPAS